jgi:integrase
MKKRKSRSQSEDPNWRKTSVQHLYEFLPSGTMFARFHCGGKLIRQSLKTKLVGIGDMRLRALIDKEEKRAKARKAMAGGRMTMGQAWLVYQEDLDKRVVRGEMMADGKIKPRTRAYYNERGRALFASWRGLAKVDARDVTREECERWLDRFEGSATAVNNTRRVLEAILDVAVKAGAIYENPATDLPPRKIQGVRRPTVPDAATFLRFVEAIDKSGRCSCHQAAAFVEFLAYSGLRKSEAAAITWGDCDMQGGWIHARITKNGEERKIPMIPPMRKLLERLRAEDPGAKPTDPVLKVREAQISMDRAAKQLGIPRLRHHDLRHTFSTLALQATKDVRTVAEWLGHKDRGALLLKTYSHVLDEHSQEMSKLVTFAPKPAKENPAPTPPAEPTAQSATSVPVEARPA